MAQETNPAKHSVICAESDNEGYRNLQTLECPARGYTGSAYARCACGARLERGRRFCSHACYSASLRVSIESRFWSKINKNAPPPARCSHLGPCWLFTGKARLYGGYGSILGTVEGKRRPLYTHRLSWELTRGPIPDGLFVLHKCDVPLCCNPDHLFLGSQADNLADARQKGRLVPGQRKRSLNGIEALAHTSDEGNQLGEQLSSSER